MAKAEYKDRKYDIRPYDPTWPDQFQLTQNAVRRVFGRDALAIEHIGSTSVPGMSGKPTIDVLVLVENIKIVEQHISEMKAAGYECLVDYVLSGTILFRHAENGAILSNIHIFQKDHPHVREMLVLRDYFRSHPEEAKVYSDLKDELFRKYPEDYATYRKLKDSYMEELKKRVL